MFLVALVPVFLFALLHACTYTKNLLNVSMIVNAKKGSGLSPMTVTHTPLRFLRHLIGRLGPAGWVTVIGLRLGARGREWCYLFSYRS